MVDTYERIIQTMQENRLFLFLPKEIFLKNKLIKGDSLYLSELSQNELCFAQSGIPVQIQQTVTKQYFFYLPKKIAKLKKIVAGTKVLMYLSEMGVVIYLPRN